jgi:hypothetical protein
MPFAPQDYVKVYLLGLKYSQSYVNNMLSTDTVAKTLGITRDEVHAAWRDWSEQDIIKLYPYPRMMLKAAYVEISLSRKSC